MNNKEAIGALEHIYGMVSSEVQKALDVAITAIERQSTEHQEFKEDSNKIVDLRAWDLANIEWGLDYFIDKHSGWEIDKYGFRVTLEKVCSLLPYYTDSIYRISEISTELSDSEDDNKN